MIFRKEYSYQENITNIHEEKKIGNQNKISVLSASDGDQRITLHLTLH